MKVSVLCVSSESCDHYGPYVFKRKLNDKQLIKFLQKECPGDWTEEEGPGFAGSWLYPEWSTTEVH
jgi:hypothetical protein